MKIFLAFVAVATLASSLVSAATIRKRPTATIEDLEEQLDNFECAIGAITGIFEGGDLEKDFHELSLTISQGVSDRKKCNEAADQDKKIECLEPIFMKDFLAYNKFAYILMANNDGMLEKLEELIKARCMKQFDPRPVTYDLKATERQLDIFECAVDKFSEIIDRNFFGKELRTLVVTIAVGKNTREQCHKLPDRNWQYTCLGSIFMEDSLVYNMFLSAVKERNSRMLEEITNQTLVQCTLTLDPTLPPNSESIERQLDQFECALDVVKEINAKSDFSKEFKTLFWTVRFGEINRKKCYEIEKQGGEDSVVECLNRIVAEEFVEFTKFYSILDEKNKGILKEVKDQAASCSSNVSLLTSHASPHPSIFFQCLADSVGEAWTANGLAVSWSKIQPKLQLHLDNWKNCVNAGSSEAIDACNANEAKAVYDLQNECVKMMTVMDPKVLHEFSRIARENCVE